MKSTNQDKTWQGGLKSFFTERASLIKGQPSLEDLCYVSGRDSRLWLQQGMYDDLINNLISILRLSHNSHVLEVGCAAGFLSKGLAPSVGQYTGVDLASSAIKVADRLKLKNAEFSVANGANLPFPDNTFDASFSYDVFTNFPSFEEGIPLISEMLRVTKPCCPVLIGSVPNLDKQSLYEERVKQYSMYLEHKYGQVPAMNFSPPSFLNRIYGLIKPKSKIAPAIVCYYFCIEDFQKLGQNFCVNTEICNIHTANPYVDLRFNVIYSKPS